MSRFRQLIQNRLPMGGFARNVITLMTGTAFAQVLLIFIAPILTRLYSPEEFGIYSLYTSVAAILTVIACWSYDFAIVLPEKDEDAANVLGLSILICFGMSGLTLILVSLLRTSIAKILNAPDLAIWLWFMPLSILGAGLFKALNYWSTRRKQFKRLAFRQITQSTLTAATQLGVGATVQTGPGGLIEGAIVGQLAATGGLAWGIARDEGEFFRTCINRDNLRRVALRYKKFPLYDSWSGLFNMVSTMLPPLLLGYFFTPAVVGYYALGQRVLSIPMGVIGGSIAQVFFPRATDANRDGDLGRITLDMFERLLAIGFVPLMLIAVVAPDFFALVFGERWLTAGQYVRWMGPWLLFVFISSPLSTIYYVLEKQRELFLFNVSMFFLRLLVIIIGGIHGDALVTIALFGILGILLYGFLCIHIMYLAGISIRNISVIILKQMIYDIPYCILPLVVWYCSRCSLAFVLAGIASGFIFLLVTAFRYKKSEAII